MALFARGSQTQRSAARHSHNNAVRLPLLRGTVSATLHSHENTGLVSASLYHLIAELIFLGEIARDYRQKSLLVRLAVVSCSAYLLSLEQQAASGQV